MTGARKCVKNRFADGLGMDSEQIFDLRVMLRLLA